MSYHIPQHLAASSYAPTGHNESGGYQVHKPAFRQRSAVACDYCRRRKIRCEGHEQDPQGRCSNCQHRQEECIFRPAASGGKAFVPVHAVYPDFFNRDAQQFYDGHSQPLNQNPMNWSSDEDASNQNQNWSSQEDTSNLMALVEVSNLVFEGSRRQAVEGEVQLPRDNQACSNNTSTLEPRTLGSTDRAMLNKLRRW